ncbi:hypothetical protein VB638_08625 [Dolichospermum sp. UHCC 0684]|uniref:hypothetical protein n=1 Tax=unclassified Dolichospermum TaxID=2622029 RepID=UPI001C2B7BA9|nr:MULTISPECIES: hypothetical protein [unclassified Dolichospermum]MEA5529653.1 hypothetical protein [Dolichospermum sp. UHCC 0684]
MTTILTKVQQFLDSGDINGAREEVAKTAINLEEVDTTVRDFAALLALGSQKALEIGLGVLGRELIKRDLAEINNDVVWLLLASILSRHNITSDSPLRISIIGLISCIKDWELPIFALLSPSLDSFFKVSLSEENPLISEQTLDFISTWGENYAKAPRTIKQLKEFKSLTQSVLDKVDDLDIKEEWAEGVEKFLQIARQKKYNKYSYQCIGSDISNLLKTIYNPNPAILNSDTGASYYKVQDNIWRLITSCLASWGTIVYGNGLSIAVRIYSPEKTESQPVFLDELARQFREIEYMARQFREIEYMAGHNIREITPFISTQIILESRIIIFYMDLKSKQSNFLAEEIKSLYDGKYEENRGKLRINLAISTNALKFDFDNFISTEKVHEFVENSTSITLSLQKISPTFTSLIQLINLR